ncbi:hypothetical protein CDAR_523001 [Caerostris darwini]|uniref:Uncharacterized protein n=1 Tax=Caerostris darwini TaxID=1538125 RepID=A0AAV4TEF7_9ARAC|nr:hypothetical protein CDAR_523001 [Caerostris darwini]
MQLKYLERSPRLGCATIGGRKGPSSSADEVGGEGNLPKLEPGTDRDTGEWPLLLTTFSAILALRSQTDLFSLPFCIEA